MALAYCDYISYIYAGTKTKIPSPLKIDYQTAGISQSNRSEFDLYFPALIVFSFIMVLFTAAATLVKEIEKGTINRLKLSKLSTFECLTAVTINQLIIGITSMMITLLCGMSVGYRLNGSIGLIILVGLAVTFSVIAISIITTCYIRTMFGLLTVGCFPFFVLMFFSDCFIPLPKFKLIELWGNPIFANDILPTAVGVRAFNKIMNFNAHISDITFELALIIILGLVYFLIGSSIFKRRFMSI
jgi:ABC-2 type transport system permease protein